MPAMNGSVPGAIIESDGVGVCCLVGLWGAVARRRAVWRG